MVVVDGLDGAGNVTIRDPQDGTRYEMTRDDFLQHWTGRVVFH
jgi:ABC-type bacteriocin/lantibiotic exporter with double-glycine peptidase domain